jgi:hypothetical protein
MSKTCNSFTTVDSNSDTAIDALVSAYGAGSVTEMVKMLLARAVLSYQLAQNRTTSESTLSSANSATQAAVNTTFGTSV